LPARLCSLFSPLVFLCFFLYTCTVLPRFLCFLTSVFCTLTFCCKLPWIFPACSILLLIQGRHLKQSTNFLNLIIKLSSVEMSNKVNKYFREKVHNIYISIASGSSLSSTESHSKNSLSTSFSNCVTVSIYCRLKSLQLLTTP